MIDQLFLNAISYLKTKDAMTAFVSRIDNALLQLSDSKELKNLEQFFSLKEIGMIQQEIKDVEELRSLKERLLRIDVINIQLPFSPTAYFESNLIDSILKIVKTPCVVQITVVRNLIGGAIIDYQGKYRDYTIKSAIEEWRKRKR